MDIFFRNQVTTLGEIRPVLDAVVNNCFESIRKDVENDFVFIDEVDTKTNLLINKYDCYKIPVPKDWKLDNTNFQYVTNFFNDDFKLSIFREEVDLSYDYPQLYINYSNYYIRQNYGEITLLADETISIGPFLAQTIGWKRNKLSIINNDLNFYFEVNIILNDKEVLTFLLKSSQNKIENYTKTLENAISKIIFIDKTEEYDPQEILRDPSDIILTGEEMSVVIPKDKCVLGVYHAPHNDYTQELIELEKSINFKFELIMDYYSFKTRFAEVEESLRAIYRDNRFMLITLQPFISKTAKDYDGSCLIPKIANGEYDEFLFEWACGLKALKKPVFLRFANEMNGDWTEWCSWFYSLDPDLFIMAWNRVYSLFDKVGADNVYFVWNPHDRTYPDYNWNKEHLYYPGNDKVDWIGLTAYNNGITRPNEKWRDFETCYDLLYTEYLNKYYLKPFLITEFACNEIGGDKGEWITNSFKLLREKYPNIRLAVWWNGVDDRWIYDIDSSDESKEAFKEAISNSYFQLEALCQPK